MGLNFLLIHWLSDKKTIAHQIMETAMFTFVSNALRPVRDRD